jgi:hypothetical protein
MFTFFLFCGVIYLMVEILGLRDDIEILKSEIERLRK